MGNRQKHKQRHEVYLNVSYNELPDPSFFGLEKTFIEYMLLKLQNITTVSE